MTTRRKIAAAALLIYFVVVWVAPLPTLISGRLSQIAVVGAAATVGVLWLRAGYWGAGRLRLGMLLLGTGSLSWALAEAIWLVDGWSSGGVNTPIGATSNAAFSVAMIGTPIAVTLMVRRPSASIRTLLDGALIGLSLLFVVWALVIGPQLQAGQHGLGSVAYAVADALIVSLVVLLLGDAHPALRSDLQVAAGGMVLMFAADSTYAGQAVSGSYRFGALPDLLWFAAFVVLATAFPHGRELHGRSALTERQRNRHYLPYVPFALAFVTAVAVPLAQHHIDAPLYGFSLALTLFVVIRQMITLGENRSLTGRLSTAVDDLRFRAYHDPLTGLANRALFEDALERALGLDGTGDVTVLYIDLDGFKPINDSYGHEYGDQALVVIAGRLEATCAPDDVVARLGGDEFAVLTGNLPDAEQLLAAMRVPLELSDCRVSIGASIGIAQGQPGGTTPGELLRKADAAMYAAKRRGRDQVVVFEEADSLSAAP